MPKWGVLIIGLIAFIVLIAFVVFRTRLTRVASVGCPDFTAQRLMLGAKEITVALADSPAERMQGLSGCPEIPANSGMYFVISPVQATAFWMKNMLVPLDIIWIKDGKAIGLVANVPPPVAGQPDTLLPQYHAPSTVDAVLELPTGSAATLGIKTGTTIKPI